MPLDVAMQRALSEGILGACAFSNAAGTLESSGVAAGLIALANDWTTMCMGKANFAGATSAGLAVCSGFDNGDMQDPQTKNQLSANAESFVPNGGN
jgi:hypothetical protein